MPPCRPRHRSTVPTSSPCPFSEEDQLHLLKLPAFSHCHRAPWKLCFHGHGSSLLGPSLLCLLPHHPTSPPALPPLPRPVPPRQALNISFLLFPGLNSQACRYQSTTQRIRDHLLHERWRVLVRGRPFCSSEPAGWLCPAAILRRRAPRDGDEIAAANKESMGLPTAWSASSAMTSTWWTPGWRPPGFWSKNRKEKVKDGFEERVVRVGRVTKVVKAGKQLHSRAIVVVGDKKGQVGVRVGKAMEVIAAVQKSAVNARRNILTVPMTKYFTFPHR